MEQEKKYSRPVIIGLTSSITTTIILLSLFVSGQLKIAFENSLYLTLIVIGTMVATGVFIPRGLNSIFGRKIEKKIRQSPLPKRKGLGE